MQQFPPTRTQALAQLAQFLPIAGRSYAARRNLDLGPGQPAAVSRLSPYIRHRVITEAEVLQAVLARHSPDAAEKFIQEVLWRTYWKGWLELRPGVWHQYRNGLKAALDQVQVQSGLRAQWQAACEGATGIGCFDAWAKELVQTGYLHNHTRMWFASIWIFTLRLPWELGADFFLRHLLDGDPASNTLGWRWVAGIQTPGKTYLARPDNIARCTEGRWTPAPGELASVAVPIAAPAAPARGPVPGSDAFDPSLPTAFVLHDEDLSPGWLFDLGLTPCATATLTASGGVTPLHMSPQVTGFRSALLADSAQRWQGRLGVVTAVQTAKGLSDWAKASGAQQIVTAYAPVGPVADVLNDVQGLPVRQIVRDFDARAWPYATAGFFKFKDKIPLLLEALQHSAQAPAQSELLL